MLVKCVANTPSLAVEGLEVGATYEVALYGDTARLRGVVWDNVVRVSSWQVAQALANGWLVVAS